MARVVFPHPPLALAIEIVAISNPGSYARRYTGL
jgi:hypothetical protein